MTTGAFGPTNIATAPAPPVLRALPAAYTAMSAATTIARRPVDQQCQMVSLRLLFKTDFTNYSSILLQQLCLHPI